MASDHIILAATAVPLEQEVISPASPFTPQALLIASLSFAVVSLALFFFARRKSSSKGNAVLLVGAPDAGKTAILSTLAYGHTLPSHASLQTNSSVLALPGGKVALSLVDVPGHPRIRDQYRDHMSSAKAIVFVVDASTISRNGAAVAEHLHQILHAVTSLPPSQATPALLILAHKCDLLKGTSASTTSEQLAVNRVRTILERELEKRRAAQAGGVGVEGLGAESGEGGEIGGLESAGTGGAFRFADWEGGEVQFLGTSVQTARVEDEKASQADGLSALREWLEEL